MIMKSALLFVVLLLSACTQTPRQEAMSNEPIKTYQLTGEITAMDAPTQVVTIKHEEIKGWMDAMTMGFPIKEKAEFEKLKPGAKITADVNVQGNDFWLTKIVQKP
jgi:Cu/Ag efflux protein CusF